MRLFRLLSAATGLVAISAHAQTESVYILDVPDYAWYAGCFGTATGNLMGFWDRNGLPDLYTGPTGGGVAPLIEPGPNRSDTNIYALWASKAGVDGRPANQPGHMDDYYVSYESIAQDPFVTAGRAEHEPDCIGDFIGLNQRKWVNQNSECDGNIDAYAFVHWDASGNRRVNFTPGTEAGPAVDIQSGLRKWSQWRGYNADVFTQLTDFNPATPTGKGFTFEHLKEQINQGYPVLVFLQRYGQNSRTLGSLSKANPEIHGMLVYGYAVENGLQLARFRTSWGTGNREFALWSSSDWRAFLPVRGVIGFRPHPRISRVSRSEGQITLEWDGPSARVLDEISGQIQYPHRYAVEHSPTLNPAEFVQVGSTTELRTATLQDNDQGGFYRVRLDPH